MGRSSSGIFKFDHEDDWPDDRYHSSYRLREDTNGEIMTDVLRYVFLELGRFRKHLWELETHFDKWMYLLCHMHEMVEIPQIFQTEVFKRLFILSEINNFTAEEYDEYQKSISRMSDYYNIIDSAVARAEKLAREEGREEGRLELCRNLLSQGVQKDQVALAAGLSIEELDALVTPHDKAL